MRLSASRSAVCRLALQGIGRAAGHSAPDRDVLQLRWTGRALGRLILLGLVTGAVVLGIVVVERVVRNPQTDDAIVMATSSTSSRR